MIDPFARVAGLPGVEPSVTAARNAVDLLYGHRALRRRQPEITAESALRGARASAALDGADVSLSALRSGRALQDPQTAGAARAAVRLCTGLPALVDVWGRSPLQALARLHVLAAADVVDEEHVGRPTSREAAARLEQLSRLLTDPTEAPAVVVAAIVHGELLAARAFGWGNGLLARAAQRLVLIHRGLDPKALTVPEVGHLELGRLSYDAALAAYATGTADGVAAWVRHCAHAVALGAREGSAVCQAMMRH